MSQLTAGPAAAVAPTSSDDPASKIARGANDQCASSSSPPCWQCCSHPFRLWLSPLLSHACSWLETPDLVNLRRVSAHWSSASRTPAAWESSVWHSSPEVGLLRNGRGQWDTRGPYGDAEAYEDEDEGTLVEDDIDDDEEPYAVGSNRQVKPPAKRVAQSSGEETYPASGFNRRLDPYQWEANPWKRLERVSASAPYLRVLSLPFHWSKNVADKSFLARFTHLRSVVFRHYKLDATILQQHLAYVQHVARMEVDTDGNGNHKVSVAEVAALCAHHGLLSFRGTRLNMELAATDILTRLSASPSASTLRILRMEPDHMAALNAAEWGRFHALEELSLLDGMWDKQAEHFAAITALPTLRVLVLGQLRRAEQLDALLGNESFNARLEWLHLRGAQLLPRHVRRIGQQCTRLLGLVIEAIMRVGQHQFAHVYLKSLSQEQWSEAERAELAREESSQSNADAASVAGGAAVQVPLDATALSLAPFLLLPPAFRLRLLRLSLPLRSTAACAQVERRFPRMLLMHRMHTQRLSAEELEAAGVQLKWMEQDTNEAQSAGGASSSAAAAGALVAPAAAASSLPLDYFSLPKSAFHLLRALKLHVGLPLTSSERMPDMSPLLCGDLPEELDTGR